uniref:EGF-like domain-containing protein n=1 Tax=Acrobeloides nanus TaxID=290746 RepID=A0A914C3V8_9BILA
MFRSKYFIFIIFLIGNFNLIVNAYRFWEKQTKACQNDASQDNANNCVCPPYVYGDNCEQWECVNFGYGSSLTPQCECPTIIAGPHCEPINCINNDLAYDEVFKSGVTSLSLIVTYTSTYNDISSRKDNITDGILKALQNMTNLDFLYVYLTGGTNSTHLSDSSSCFKTSTGGISGCVNQLFNDADFDFSPVPCNDLSSSPCRNLITNDIQQVLESTPVGAPVVIITTTVLGDYTNEENILKITKMAIARKNPIHIITAKYLGDVIGGDATTKAYVDWSQKSMGSLIAAYDFFGYLNDSIQTFLPMFLPLTINVKVSLIGQNPIIGQNIENICGEYCDSASVNIYIAAFQYNIKSVLSLNVIIPSNSSTILNTKTAIIKKAPFSSLLLVPDQDNQIQYNYQVWIESSIASSGFVGYVQNEDADISSTIPVEGVPNLIVAHITTPPTSVSVGFTATLINSIGQLGNASFNSSIKDTHRPSCLHNINLGELTCNVGDWGAIQITSNNSEFYNFQQVVPFFCGSSNDTFSSIKDFPASIIKANDEILLLDKQIDDITCDGNVDNSTYPALNYDIQTRTFALILSNNNVFTQALFNTSFEKQLVAILYNYIKSYGDGYFDSFLLNLFFGDTQNISQATTFSLFRTQLIQGIDGFDLSSTCSSPTSNISDSINALLKYGIYLVPNFLRPYSEIFVLTDHNFGTPATFELYRDLYGYLGSNKNRINFIIYRDPETCYPNTTDIDLFRELAWKSNGFLLVINNTQHISTFFDLYQHMQRSQIVLIEYVKGTWLNMASKPFKYVQNRTYIAFIQYSGEFNLFLKRTSDNSSTQLTDQTLFGDRPNIVSIVKLPTNLTTGDYQILASEIPSVLFNPSFMLKLIEVIDISSNDTYYTGFASSQRNDAAATYPTYGANNPFYPVIHSTNNAKNISLSISNENLNDIYSGSSQTRSSCHFEQFLDFSWYCTELEEMYYVQINSDSATRTEVIPCYSTSNNNNPCLHSGTYDPARNICICTSGWTGDRCQTIQCANNGTSFINGSCACLDGSFGGQFCDISNLGCVDNPAYPEYTTEIKTLILIVEMQSTQVIINQLRDSITQLDNGDSQQIYRQYILGYYYCTGVSTTEYRIKTFTEYSKFKDAIIALASVTINSPCASPSEVEGLLKDTLSISTTQRSLLIWLASSNYRCSQGYDPDLIQLVAIKRAEIRIFYSLSTTNLNCFQKIAALGNGLAISVNDNEWKNIPNYINTVTPTAINNYQLNQLRLNVLDHVYLNETGDNCTFDVTLNLDTGASSTFIIYLKNIILNQTGTDNILNNVIRINNSNVNFPRFIFQSNGSNTPGCGYSIETFSSLEYGYGYVPLLISSRPKKFAFSNLQSNHLIYTIRNTEINSSTVEFTYIDPNTGYYNPLYSALSTTKRTNNCLYQSDVEFNCNGFEGPIKSKIYGPDNGGYQITFPTHCIKSTNCGEHGKDLPFGGCLCFENCYTTNQSFVIFNTLINQNVAFWSGIPYYYVEESNILELSLLGGAIHGDINYNTEIVEQFVIALKGSDEIAPTPTPTPRVKSCVVNSTADIYIYYDVTSLATKYKTKMLDISNNFIQDFTIGENGTIIGTSDNQLACGRNFTKFLIYMTSHPTVDDEQAASTAKQSLPSDVNIYAIGFDNGQSNYTWWAQNIVNPISIDNVILVNDQTDIEKDVVQALWTKICTAAQP